MADVFMVKETWMSVWVHKGPGTSYAHKGVIHGKDKKKYTVTKRGGYKNYWVHLKEIDGWCCTKDANGRDVLKKTKADTKRVAVAATVNNKKTTNEEEYKYIPDNKNLIYTSAAQFESDLEKNFGISNIRGIFGMPYQFMESADPRIETVTKRSDSIGRKYAKEIVSSMPLLLIIPGKPVFMSKYSKKERKTMLGKFLGAAAGEESKITDTVFNEKFGKYYSLEYDYNGYFKYVNPMCRIAARVMNLQDKEIDGVKLDAVNWSNKVNENFNKLFSIYRGCTAWYCDSDTSISDSFSNNTTESMIASKINSVSDYGRELNFLLGTVKSETGVALDKFVSEENLTQNMQNVNEFINKTLGNNSVSGIFSSITNSAQTVIAGGKLVFPEIWESSQFSRSYSVHLKLVSPDGDNLSVYLNIIVPMLHLLALVLPRETDNAHGYISPFLVRAFYKGMFNVDMGIVSDLTFNKGKEAAWTAQGIPTIVEVDLTIKDLYNDMYMTSQNQMKHNMMNNIILMDYISNMCGVNINEIDIYRSIDLFLTQNISNRIRDTWRMNTWGASKQWISNKVLNIYSGIFPY